MTNQSDEHVDAQSLIQKLADWAGHLEKDDLSGLAKMHSWCEALAAPTSPEGTPRAPGVAEGAKQSAQLLETLILGEAEAPDTTLATIAEKIRAIAEIAVLGGPSPTRPDNEARVAKASDAEVADKLARIFDEEGSATETRSEGPDSGPEGTATSAAADSLAGDEPTEPGVSEPTSDGAEVVVASESSTAPTAGASAVEPPYEQLPLTINDKEMEFIKGFLEEAAEHIEASEAALLEIERSPEDTSIIDNLFRPFHTIKGMAGFLNLRDINRLTHEVETLLDQGRKGKRQITPGLIDLVFDVVDILKAQLASIATYMVNPDGGSVSQPPIAELIDKLRDVVAGRLEPEGHHPTEGVPGQKLGENLVDQGACAKEVVDFALQKQQEEPTKKTGEILTETGVATPRQVSQALRAQKPESPGRSARSAGAAIGDQSVRIETAKLDSLVDMVGELVIAQTLVGANPQIACDDKLSKDVSQVGKIVRDVQEVAMAMRMIPIGPTFQKMARLVRDVSRKAGKRVELHISGEDTELDKNVIQQIGDPLVHMVRNAVDHGVEMPEVRRSAGKPETGHVHLSASHQGGNILIKISDDGKGLDPKVLIAKGVEKGIVQHGEELSDQQAYRLVFAAGLTTAQKVTDISGRGVGMDVVRRNIEQLRGKVDISSELGQGSTFSIRLPLTLAIIDGMVVKVADERFIIQTITIEQALRPRLEHITTVQHKGEVLNVRGRLVPLIQLGAMFGFSGALDPCEAIVVIAHCEGRQIGLVVDELIGQQQVVIKTLGERFQKLQGVSGGAILGDGRVGLILEMSGLAAAHNAHLTPLSRMGRADERAPRPSDAVESAISPAGSENMPTSDEGLDEQAVETSQTEQVLVTT
jgi:two-component system chemotaxis sensor kinase CheA